MRSALAALAASARMTTLVANRQTAVMTAKVRAALISWADASVLRRSSMPRRTRPVTNGAAIAFASDFSCGAQRPRRLAS